MPHVEKLTDVPVLIFPNLSSYTHTRYHSVLQYNAVWWMKIDPVRKEAYIEYVRSSVL
jgi:hypothetical protein